MPLSSLTDSRKLHFLLRVTFLFILVYLLLAGLAFYTEDIRTLGGSLLKSWLTVLPDQATRGWIQFFGLIITTLNIILFFTVPACSYDRHPYMKPVQLFSMFLYSIFALFFLRGVLDTMINVTVDSVHGAPSIFYFMEVIPGCIHLAGINIIVIGFLVHLTYYLS